MEEIYKKIIELIEQVPTELYDGELNYLLAKELGLKLVDLRYE